MPSMDVFESDAFSVRTLTALVNEASFVPGRIGEMMLFQEQGIMTTKVAVERSQRTFGIVPITARGGPPTQNVREGRDMIDFSIPRLAMEDMVYADEIQNVRAFGSDSAVISLQSEVAQRNARMARSIDATLERHRVGALMGQVLDADDSVYLNLFTAFNRSQPATIDFVLGTATTVVRTKCSQVIRAIEDALGINVTQVHALVDSSFFDKLVDHANVTHAFESQSLERRERTARRQFFFAGILFEEYRDPLGWITADAGIAFPVGPEVRQMGMYVTRFGPADWWDTVNTTGLPRYARQFPDPSGGDRGRRLETQTNALNIVTRPDAIIPIETSN